MKKIVLLIMGLFFFSQPVIAYQVNIQTPDTLPVGKPLVVTGNTTFGIGTPIDVVLYLQLTTTSEIQRKIVYIQSDKTFRAVFDTTGLEKGTYKVEVPASGLGESTNIRLVQLVDRSEDIILSSPATQNFDGRLVVAGTIKGAESTGVQIEVMSQENAVVFGPVYISTNVRGDFSTEVKIGRPGEYEVSFTAARGYIGKKVILVTNPVPDTIAVASSATPVNKVSAHAKSSRDSPSYFVVKAGDEGLVTLYTSTSIDWVMEYADDQGQLRMVNDFGELKPEKVQISGSGQTLYFKVYPYKYSVTGEVFLYAENTKSVTVSQTVPPPFASGGARQIPSETQATLMPINAIIAVVLGMLLIIQFRLK